LQQVSQHLFRGRTLTPGLRSYAGEFEQGGTQDAEEIDGPGRLSITTGETGEVFSVSSGHRWL